MQELKQLAFKVPPELAMEFKLLCIRKDTTLKDYLTKLMVEEIQKQKVENGD